jgi:hypothetical protein
MEEERKRYGRKGKVYVSSVIEGPIDAVWARTCRFADGSWMPGVSASGYIGTCAKMMSSRCPLEQIKSESISRWKDFDDFF